MEKLTKLPEDILEAVSSNASTRRKELNSETKSSKPAAVVTESGEADDESELKFSTITSSKSVGESLCFRIDE